MDLLDLLKMMVRRWYVAVPVVVVTLGIALFVGSQIRPEYKASSAVLLIPPTTRQTQPVGPPSASPRPGNPWVQVGEDAMAQALKISVSTKEARDRVSKAGGDPAYEVGLVTRSSILTFDVTTTSEDRARATMKAVIDLVRTEVANRQAQYKPKPGEDITAQVLDPGDNVQPSRSNVLRAEIVIVGIGILLAAAATVMFDAVQRRRRSTKFGVRASPGRASATVSAADKATPPGQKVDLSHKQMNDSDRLSDETMVISAIRVPTNDDR
jgi:hypothetical protein